MVNILKEMLKAHFSFELKLKSFKMHQLHLNQTCLSVIVSPEVFIHKYDIWLKCYCIHNITFHSKKCKVLYENILQLEKRNSYKVIFCVFV